MFDAILSFAEWSQTNTPQGMLFALKSISNQQTRNYNNYQLEHILTKVIKVADGLTKELSLLKKMLILFCYSVKFQLAVAQSQGQNCKFQRRLHITNGLACQLNPLFAIWSAIFADVYSRYYFSYFVTFGSCCPLFTGQNQHPLHQPTKFLHFIVLFSS